MPKQPEPFDYSLLFQDWEICLVESLARKFLDQTRIAGMDFEDLRQELFLKLWEHRVDYQAGHESQAAAETFFYRVLFRRALDILKETKRNKRIIHTRTLSESWSEESCSDPTAATGKVLEDRSATRAQKASELKADLSGVLKRFSSEQRTICELLMGETPKSDVAQQLSIHRDTLYERLNEMRRVLYQAQLDEYLKDDPTFPKKSSYKTSGSD